ncbi:type I-C CRISPR-associated protein Cas8c/Csd1 [Luteimonas sp. TWI1437]|uniref:type I-C CRISPR-associated protein Cas8c/Csd1 n=1 Tax=unclassified Luteimonas TaxID=2629088 RepID=UPI003207D9BC
MILSALADYYQRLLEDPDSGIATPGYSQEKIGYTIVLATDGSVVDVHDEHDNGGARRVSRPLDVPQPQKRTVAVKSNFLWDKTSYALGVSATSRRSAEEHEAFKALHRQTLGDSDDPALCALLMFLDRWTPAQFADDPHFARHGEAMLDTNIVFRFDGEQRYLHQRSAARAACERLQSQAGGGTRGMCLVTGEHAALARLHPAIKGVSGAQSSGASIVSFNLDAFTSYRKIQGENAPVSEQAAFAYTTALNHLLRRGSRHRKQIGDTTVVFWARAESHAQSARAEDLLAAFLGTNDAGADELQEGQANQRLQAILEQIRQARPLRELGIDLDDATRVFVLGLAPNASRLSIRFWETESLANFVERLADHHDDLALQPRAWNRPPTPQYLALQTAPIHGDKGRPKTDDIPPLLAGELTRAIFTGARYPRSVLGTVVMRFRADGQITPLRVALCKAVLARDARLGAQQGSSTDKGAPPVSLEPGNTDPGYLLGRLFSTLENVQRAALGGQLNATIRDRYYGAASATPASVFPMLLRNAQNHLGKLRREKAGLAVNLEKEIGQIVDLLGTRFPRSLLIEAQGRFAIGYYHQTQARFARNEGQDATKIESEGETA